MDNKRIPKPGEIYNHFKDKPYQIITVATNTETLEPMVVYQALYGDFKTYVRPLEMFLSEVDQKKYPEVKQKHRFMLRRTQDGEPVAKEEDGNAILNKPVTENTIVQTQTIREQPEQAATNISVQTAVKEEILIDRMADQSTSGEAVNEVLLQFLDAQSYTKKLEILTSNAKHLNDRLINDMAVSLDCTVDEGPMDQRIQGLIYCLKQLCRFEDRRLR